MLGVLVVEVEFRFELDFECRCRWWELRNGLLFLLLLRRSPSGIVAGVIDDVARLRLTALCPGVPDAWCRFLASPSAVVGGGGGGPCELLRCRASALFVGLEAVEEDAEEEEEEEEEGEGDGRAPVVCRRRSGVAPGEGD